MQRLKEGANLETQQEMAKLGVAMPGIGAGGVGGVGGVPGAAVSVPGSVPGADQVMEQQMLQQQAILLQSMGLADPTQLAALGGVPGMGMPGAGL